MERLISTRIINDMSFSFEVTFMWPKYHPEIDDNVDSLL